MTAADRIVQSLKLASKLSVKDVEVKDKRVLMRVDYNVPLTLEGNVGNNQRIVSTLPTINYLLGKGAKSIILMSHLGRPDGEIIEKMSLRPVSHELERLLGRKVIFLADCVGTQVEEACLKAKDGQVILLENLRFHIEEEGSVKRKDGTKIVASPKDISKFRRSLSALGEIYVNDAFGTVHRAHSSITGIELTPRVAGLLINKELNYFSKILESPKGIDLAILGGAKVSDKIQLIKNLLSKVKKLAIGGGMSFTPLKVLDGMEIGKSLYDEKGALLVPEIMAEAEKYGVELILPRDFITGSSLNQGGEDTKLVGYSTIKGGIPNDMMGLDIGPESIKIFIEAISSAKTILWNGPVGVFELDQFSNGTKSIVEALVKATQNGAITIVGGGDSGAAVAKWNAEEKLSHVSTGGGASLELLEGHTLPGIVALTDRD